MIFRIVDIIKELFLKMFLLTNVCLQTQNMSLSQDNLADSQNWTNSSTPSAGVAPTMGNSMSAGMGAPAAAPGAASAAAPPDSFGYSGTMAPLTPYDYHHSTSASRDMAARRASDPVRPLDRPIRGGRLQRTNSYSNFNHASTLAPVSSNQRHPNQGLSLDQVGDDEPIENKLILPDDMVNYLNQVCVQYKIHICLLLIVLLVDACS